MISFECLLRHAFAVAALALVTSAAMAEPSARTMADTCAVCHGTNGRSAGGIDGLAGRSAASLLEEMREKRIPGHDSRLMSIIANGFTDAQVQAMGAYFATLPR
jgi:cytochrome c553